MPGYDRKGPLGEGARTGWGRGLCRQQVGQEGSSFGGFLRGLGRGGAPRGGGRGRRFGDRGGWWGAFGRTAPLSPSEEGEALRADLSAAKQEVATMEARLSELEKKE